MTNLVLQHNFTHGELDPRIFSSVDLTVYYKGASKIRNAYVRAQGGVKRRHGSIYKATITSAAGEYKLDSFILGGENNYLLVFIAGNLEIYREETTGLVIQQTLTTPYTGAQLPEIRTSQNGSMMVVVHPDHAPYELTHGGSHTSWTFAAMSIKNQPAYDFQKNYYTATFTLSNAGVGKGHTLTSTAAVFTADFVGGLFLSLPKEAGNSFGVARITGYTNTTNVTVDVTSAFDASLASGGVIGSSCFLGEPAFSAANGYPQTVAFYEDRLVFGGTPALPQTLFLSKIAEYQNYDQGSGLDDDAIVYTLSSGQYDEIKHLISDKSLQIFCDQGEYSSMQYFAEPLTPDSATFRKQSTNGSTDCPPQIINNQTFYVRKGGKGVMSFEFDADSTSYSSIPTSLYSSHLIDNPVDGTILKGDAVEDDNYLFLVNTDGSLLCFQTVIQENIAAWSLQMTGPDVHDPTGTMPDSPKGKYKAIQRVDDRVYVIVERKINSTTVEYIEELTFDVLTDSSISQTFTTARTNITGLDNLEGETVRVVTENGIQNDAVVNGGAITLSDPAKNVKVGLNFNVWVRSIPINVAGSSSLYLVKRIIRAWVDYYESQGIYVNDAIIPELDFSNLVLGKAPAPKTGVYEALISGSTDQTALLRPTVDFIQYDPLPFLIIGLGFEVTV